MRDSPSSRTIQSYSAGIFADHLTHPSVGHGPGARSPPEGLAAPNRSSHRGHTAAVMCRALHYRAYQRPKATNGVARVLTWSGRLLVTGICSRHMKGQGGEPTPPYSQGSHPLAKVPTSPQRDQPSPAKSPLNPIRRRSQPIPEGTSPPPHSAGPRKACGLPLSDPLLPGQSAPPRVATHSPSIWPKEWQGSHTPPGVRHPVPSYSRDCASVRSTAEREATRLIRALAPHTVWLSLCHRPLSVRSRRKAVRPRQVSWVCWPPGTHIHTSGSSGGPCTG